MTEPFQVTVPLVIRSGDGRKRLMAECFPHPQGLIYLDPFWHRKTPAEAAHLVQGELKGDGPWKIGDQVISVVGCQGTDPELSEEASQWLTYLQQRGAGEYPPPEQIRKIARRLGASV